MRSKPEVIRDILSHTVEAIERESIQRRFASGKKLRIKLGADPTAPDLHLGHAVALRELAKLQSLGHTIVFIIGDFTARIGDPSGRSQVRKPLTPADIRKNAKTYFSQVGKIINVAKAEIRYNSEWLGELRAEDILRLNSEITVSRILERDDFKKRLGAGQEVWMHELQYPIFQAYDSVAVRADIEVGGTDQLFNFMVARHLMERRGMAPQDIMIFPILPGLDGKEKMSKSLGNYVAITDSPRDMFGKLMSIPDDAIATYFKLTTARQDRDVQEIETRLKRENPRDIKLELAKEVVAIYHGAPAAERARMEFIRVFSKKEIPEDIELASLAPGSYEAAALVLTLKLARSRSEAFRLVEQGALELIPPQGVRIRPSAPRELIRVEQGSVVRLGKTRFLKIA